MVESLYTAMFTASLIFIGLCVFSSLVRSVIGPSVCDRIVSVNMSGTLVIAAIAILSVMLAESYLADICLIYVLISFIAVTVLAKVYLIKLKKGGNKNG